LIEEIATVSSAVTEVFQPDKLNVAALGNMVDQLHIHVVARFRSDPAWPAPVWGRSPPQAYSEAGATAVLRLLADRLGSALRTAEDE
jgi:diadenosine tetraphosphate (Ap4A) HIT family hydrolase